MTTKYYLWVQEEGGCDYTVGCGEKLMPLNATTVVAAKEEALSMMEDLGLYGSGHETKHAVIYTFVENITHLYEREKATRNSVIAEELKQKEIEALEAKLKQLKGAGT